MFGLRFNRRTADHPTTVRPVLARPAALEPLESRQLLSASGLTIVETRSTLPTTQISTATLKGNVSFRVTNSLTTTISGPQTFAVLGSTTGAITNDSIVLGSLGRSNFRLAAGKSLNLTVPVRKAAPAVGTYTVLIEATDANQNTSTVATAPDVDVEAPVVTLSATVGTPRPTALLVNRVVTFKVTIVNTGNIDATGVLSATIELASPTTNTVVDTLGNPVRRNARIGKGGKAVTLTYTVRVTDTGTFDIGGSFTQGSDTFTAFSTTPITIGSNAA